MAKYKYGPFSMDLEKQVKGYQLKIQVGTNFPTTIHLMTADVYNGEEESDEELAEYLVGIAFPHICSDEHDFRLLAKEIYKAGQKEGTETVRREFRQLMGL